MNDLQTAYEALSGKAGDYTQLWEYYDGEHPLTYSTARLRQVFRQEFVRFTQNWCGVIIDAAFERLNLARFQVAQNQAATDALNKLFMSTELILDSDDAHLAALVTGEAFVIVWRNDGDGNAGQVEAFYNDPRLCHVQYSADNPRVKDWAAKWWQGADGKYRLTLYYPDRLEYYIATKDAKSIKSAKDFVPMEPPSAPNPFGIVPVFHLRRERRKVKPELDSGVISVQNAINKLFADMMVSAEFGAFRQRWIISNADTGNLKNAPWEIWSIPAGDGQGQQTQVGEFSETSLSLYLETMDSLAHSLAIVTRTPKHYFWSADMVPSGEALIAMEAPLNKKVTRYIERFTPVWRKVGAFMLRLADIDVDEADIEPIFDRPETVQPRTQAEIRQLSVGSGMPLTTVVRTEEGWSEAQIEQMRQDRQAEQADAQQSLAQALLEQQRRFDQNQGADEGEGDG